MRDIFLRSRAWQKTAVDWRRRPVGERLGLRIHHVSYFKSAAHFAMRAQGLSECMKVPASLASGR
jgi:uncharacterized protein YkuJ